MTDMHREDFDEWRDSLPEKHWARYDLSACKLGFDAGYQAAMRYRDEQEKQA
jgi:hypothetical protein